MTAAQRWAVVGSGVSCLVLAERLSAYGHAVDLINPQGSWGGVFAGCRFDEQVFDVGMTNFEFRLFGAPRDDLASYDPDRKDAVPSYVHFAADYLHRFTDVHEVPEPHMAWRGRRFPDLLINNRFEALQALTPDERNRVRAELTQILAGPMPLHPRHKKGADSPLLRCSFEEASRANHGDTLHRLLIEPMFRKVLHVPTSDVPAQFHRAGWAPLFYPETLLSQLTDTPQELPRTVFHYPTGSHFGAFIDRLVDVILNRPGVRVRTGARDLTITESTKPCLVWGAETIPYDRLAWGHDLASLARQRAVACADVLAAPEVVAPPRASLDLFFLRIRSDALARPFSVVLDPSADTPVFRVTDQTVCARADRDEHAIVLEANADSTPEPAVGMLTDTLRKHDIDPEGVVFSGHRRFARALPIPTPAYARAFQRLRDRVRAIFPDVALLGPSSGLTSVTLNDHVLQALKLARQQGAWS